MDGLRVNKNCEHNNPTKIGAMTKGKYINLETLWPKACLVKGMTSLRFYFLCLSAWGCDCHLLAVCSWRLMAMTIGRKEVVTLLDLLYLICCWFCVLANKICVEMLCGGRAMEDCNKKQWWGLSGQALGKTSKKLNTLRYFFVCDSVSIERHCIQNLFSVV
jgi:hypothetical protein